MNPLQRQGFKNCFKSILNNIVTFSEIYLKKKIIDFIQSISVFSELSFDI